MKGNTSEEPANKAQRVIVVIFMAIALVCAVALLGLFHREDNRIEEKKLNSFSIGERKEIEYNIDYQGVSSDGSYLVKGWCVKPGVEYSFYNYGNDAYRKSVYNNMHIGFTDGETVYILPTKLENRDDIDQYINDGIDYQFCGFQSRLPKEKSGRIKKGALVLIWKNPDGSQELYYL